MKINTFLVGNFMSSLSEFNALVSSINVSEENLQKINELKNCFDENHIEDFLEKLNQIDNIDELLESSENSPENTNLFLDFVSDLIINK